MRPLSSLPRRRLYALLAVVGVLGLTGGIAQATLRDDGPKPPSRPLALAVMDAVQQAPKIEGVTARIHFTNNLLSAGSLPDGTRSPLAAGADGRLWFARDGRFRLDLTSEDGDAQIASDGDRVTVYDRTSETQYRFTLPAGTARALSGGGLPAASLMKALGPLLDQVTISGAKPGTTAGRPSYTVRVAPKDDGGLLAAAELTWDAEKGVPLRAAVYAQDDERPVLELAVTEIAYGPVTDEQLSAAAAPPGARTVDLNRNVVHSAAARRLGARAGRQDGATGKELAPALGTIVSLERDGVSYVVAGLVPPVAAENAARGLR